MEGASEADGHLDQRAARTRDVSLEAGPNGHGIQEPALGIKVEDRDGVARFPFRRKLPPVVRVNVITRPLMASPSHPGYSNSPGPAPFRPIRRWSVPSRARWRSSAFPELATTIEVSGRTRASLTQRSPSCSFTVDATRRTFQRGASTRSRADSSTMLTPAESYTVATPSYEMSSSHPAPEARSASVRRHLPDVEGEQRMRCI